MTPSKPLPTLYITKIDQQQATQMIRDFKEDPERVPELAQQLQFTFAATVTPAPDDIYTKELDEKAMQFAAESYYLGKITDYSPEFYASHYFLASNTTPEPDEATLYFVMLLNYSDLATSKVLTVLFKTTQSDILNWANKKESAEIYQKFSESLIL